ncbi:MAG: cation-translocating P-type ATPase [Lachnospiraceae bacterium]|nr:cation-translocating P-type ATPase [Lachnospiraceae bacterium]
MKYYLQEAKEVLGKLESSPNGLTEDEAKERIVKYGENKLKEKEKESLIHKFLMEICEPMTIVLIIAAVISAITAAFSHEGFADVFIILTVVIVNAILGVYQESKAESAIAALQEIAAATTKVIRNNEVKVINATELVPGDVISLEAGDAVPADARIIEAASLKCEEAALTGESVPSEKSADVLNVNGASDVPLGDRANMIYMGSSVQYGRCKAVVTGTGMDTEMGKIADQLSQAENGETPLQIKLNELSKVLSIMVLIICAVIFAINIIRNLVTGQGLNGEFFINTFMIAISLAVAAIPEGLAAVVTVLLSIGVTRMSKNKAIIRKLTAVETLGCTQIICSDKTGTLTQNKMTVVRHVSLDGKEKVNTPDAEKSTVDFSILIKGMALCSDAVWEGDKAVGEATECALVTDAAKIGLPTAELKKMYPRKGEAPFDSIRKMMSTIHSFEADENITEAFGTSAKFIQFTKGAPDCVLDCCTHFLKDGKVAKMDDKTMKSIKASNKAMADEALRVLALGVRVYDAMPGSTAPADLENGLVYIGLCGMIDPIRPEVKVAIEHCRQAGIRPVMITGDHRDTAVAIAKELGILHGTDASGKEVEFKAITGAELEEMSDDYFNEHVVDFSVYARVQPEHKVRIVNAWQGLGRVTAMTGDGVNDAPSIKSADIGVGMGITGTDVTKNVADMILTDDNFATIVSAVAEGRRIYDNIRKAIQFLLSSNLAEVIAIFIATIMNFTILKPAHLLWINLITDCFPAIGLGMEEAEKNVMNQPPRNKEDGMFADGLGLEVVVQGAIIAILTVFSYMMGHYYQAGNFNVETAEEGMTMAFLTLSMVEVFHSFNMRSRTESIFTIKKQNKVLWITFAASIVLTILVIYVPGLNKVFSFTALSLKEFATAVGIALLIIPIVEIMKAVKRAKHKSKN